MGKYIKIPADEMGEVVQALNLALMLLDSNGLKDDAAQVRQWALPATKRYIDRSDG